MFLFVPLSSGSKEKLEWEIRYKIALGTAEAISYLHEGCQRRIIHRDIKAANVLLREDFEPQVFLSSKRSKINLNSPVDFEVFRMGNNFYQQVSCFD